MEDSCSGTKNDQLFVLEVFVDDVTLYIDRLQRREPTDLGVDLKFIDFPLIRIFQNEYPFTKEEKSKEIKSDGKSRIINFNCGQMHVFPKNAAELIQAMRSFPLVLDVYKIKGISLCPYEIIKDPMGDAEIPLYGCLCDQVTMASNDLYHLPKPYVIKNKFILLDQERMISGLIALFIRLVCIGNYIMTEFAIDGKTLLFNNHNTPDEFRCLRVPPPDESLKRAQEKERQICFPDEEISESELDLPPSPQIIMDIVQICNMLTERDQYPKDYFSGSNNRMSRRKTSIKKDEEEKEKEPWGPEKFVYIPSETNVRVTSHLSNRPCYTDGCAGGLCIGGNKTWDFY